MCFHNPYNIRLLSRIMAPMIMLLGATGDLAKKKLIPALALLFKKKKLVNVPIVCIGRRELTKDQYLDLIEFTKLQSLSYEDTRRFKDSLYYVRLDLEKTSHDAFAHDISYIDQQYQCKGDKIMYFALSADLFSPTIKTLEQAKVFSGEGFKRIAFEKPFGFDLASAESLNKTLTRVFTEDQIYRVDHYLGKELVDNILTIRSNYLFNTLWSAKHIDNVQIVISEDMGIEGRGEYYDKSGAIRDVIQNHALQMLSLISMELPKKADAYSIQKAKCDVLKKVTSVRAQDIILGQYKDYASDSHVSNSQTETFAAFKTGINTPRWKNVPFYIKAGKYLDKRYTEINLVLKNHNSRGNNVISIRINPQEGVAVQFDMKSAANNQLKPVAMEFCHRCEFGVNTPEAYERLFSEMIEGNHMLFPSWQEIRQSWIITDAVKKVITQTRVPLHDYAKNANGPRESQDLLKKDKREWIYFERKLTT